MSFVVTANKTSTEITSRQLVELLLGHSTQNLGKAQMKSPELAEALTTMLEDRNVLRTLTPRELVTIAIDVGYYYNTFLRKNNVEIEEEDAI